MKNLIKAVFLFLFFLFLSGVQGEALEQKDNFITIKYNQELGAVNKKIFGANLLAFDPSLHNQGARAPYYGHADYGAGIWDSDKNAPVLEPIELAANAGITMFRFPGGCGSHMYDWKKAIGKDREHYRFGVDEFLKVCQSVGAEPVITISFFTGNEQDAVDLIEYFNSPDDGSNPSGGTDWAKVRAENGHPEPYGVKYFEIGNETWHGNHVDIKKVSPEDYAYRYLKYYKAIKAAASSVKLGAVLYYPDWNERVMDIIGEDVDFGIVHLYPPQPGANKKTMEKMDSRNLFKIALAMPTLREEYYIQNTLEILKSKTGRNIPLAVTEYNGGFAQVRPYLYSLGNALVNAELLRIFMKPQSNILMAQHWNFLNEFWGMIANGFTGKSTELHDAYYKRPVYYVYELYNKHFGDILLDYTIDGESYNISGFSALDKILDIPGMEHGDMTQPIPYLTVNTSKSADGNKIYIIVINRNMNNNVTATIKLEGFVPQETGQSWILSGGSVTDTNEKSSSTVRIRQGEFKIKDDTFVFTFKSYSLTAIEIEKG